MNHNKKWEFQNANESFVMYLGKQKHIRLEPPLKMFFFLNKQNQNYCYCFQTRVCGLMQDYTT